MQTAQVVVTLLSHSTLNKIFHISNYNNSILHNGTFGYSTYTYIGQLYYTSFILTYFKIHTKYSYYTYYHTYNKQSLNNI
jgi:hypothetical protein